MRRKMFFFF